MQWTVLLPAKALPAAKSRLLPATPDARVHRSLVEALRADTLAAAGATEGVARVLVVVDRGTPGPHTIVQRDVGLNAAVLEGASYAGQRWPADGVAVLVGDLPALRPAELGAVLRAAACHPVTFVADHAGTGTTLLAARPGQALRPAFGPASAERHAETATALDAGPGLRLDVDTAEDLEAAAELGLGRQTAAVVRDLGFLRRSPCSGIMG